MFHPWFKTCDVLLRSETNENQRRLRDYKNYKNLYEERPFLKLHMPDIRVHFKGNYEELLNAVDDIVNKNKEGYVGVFMQISSWPSNGELGLAAFIFSILGIISLARRRKELPLRY
ncbi:unnamed protein product [Dracunculus medinensis]|uniref:Ionotropic receptor n=1 Tax=Dracunculus medinensis TaxID=318479 RepID=A0A0N4U8C6_DRAME|nr:unnamed protein product [Dracunculus medinensis]